MKYALNNGARIEASKGTRGICPCCGSELIARCGDIKIHHWAHKSSCDPWWEPETEWHRSWKNKFPVDFQEVSFSDPNTGEKHFADIKTNHGVVIEFQHSHIDPNERSARENFYKEMIWVVDGTRLKRDYSRFVNGIRGLRRTSIPNFFLMPYPEKCFPINWIESSVPVIFDFLGTELIEKVENLKRHVYLLRPKTSRHSHALMILSRESLVSMAKEKEFFNFLREQGHRN